MTTVKLFIVMLPGPLCLMNWTPVTLTKPDDGSTLPDTSSEYEPLAVVELLPDGSTMPALYSSETVRELL